MLGRLKIGGNPWLIGFWIHNNGPSASRSHIGTCSWASSGSCRCVPDLLGLAAGGSFAHGPMDQYSDLDLKVVVHPRQATAVMGTRHQIAESLGELLVAYTAEHIGLPQMLVCLYANGPIHVALNFVTPEELASEPEQSVILWDGDGTLEEALAGRQAASSGIDWQWIEDRFWVWTHCALTKVGRGELFSALEYLSFIREKVLGPIVPRDLRRPAVQRPAGGASGRRVRVSAAGDGGSL